MASITKEVLETKPQNVLGCVSVITISNPYHCEWPQPLISLRNFTIKLVQLYAYSHFTIFVPTCDCDGSSIGAQTVGGLTSVLSELLLPHVVYHETPPHPHVLPVHPVVSDQPHVAPVPDQLSLRGTVNIAH